eukprot:GEMP01062805.1.p1 GENE.GEMP01062805.1~~GEMP01062805.1.p1  ORF type:complete len:355 (+),score=73.36 GEMP01062805.1:54-1118(+)
MNQRLLASRWFLFALLWRCDGRGRSAPSPCLRTYHYIHVTAFERSFAQYRKCQLTSYAVHVDYQLFHRQCATHDFFNADVIIPPCYLCRELNWPIHGGHEELNVIREGIHDTLDIINNLIEVGFSPSKQMILFLDSAGTEEAIHHGYDFVMQARVNSVSAHFRPRIRGDYADISMMPPPVQKTNWDTNYDRLEQKKYFVGFKGSFGRGTLTGERPVRELMFHKFHNDVDVIIDRNRGPHHYGDLMTQSQFLLVLRGDNVFSYRLVDAICSGGIPVLLTDRWVPPFDNLVPFTTYGVYIAEKDWNTTMDVLRALSLDEKSLLRRNALRFCNTYARNLTLQFNGLVTILTKVPRMW